ncbi:HdeD family acid-resistance protein [Bizionia argentinensis JUB59]|uniref:HdeD family acid-resistance protein n=1 Tax=Bizionia argentinensis JUB59 TaxID=1046627 RepID=G2EGD8_9FLAO|nr:DUF308 domain-containing protein [Bizionia argentinensis]EGV42497.1 HdeD family acid-resistance protein [Bizionia argentinensis JUB59]
METSFLKTIKSTVKHWYIPLLVGIFFIIVSIVAFSSPVGSLLTLSLLFALSFLLSGISESVFALINRDRLDNWGWSLGFGILTLIVGVLLLLKPELSITALAFYIGFVIMFRSISTIGFAMDVKKYGSKNWGGLLILGTIGTIVSFILIWNPLFAGLSLVVLVAINFLFAGLFSVFLSFQLRKLHKSSKKISAELVKRYDDLMLEIRNEWDD